MPSHRLTLPTRRPRAASAAAVGAATAALVLGPALAASAHVRVVPDTTAAGGYALLVLRVPNESDTASTTALQVTLPSDHPFTYAAVQPVPGWTARVAEAELPTPVDVDGTTVTAAPHTVTWTADGGADGGSAIAPGEFQQFSIAVGALPDAGTTVMLPAVQTYSDGEVVAWDQPVPAGGEEPDLPAPAFTTTAADGDGNAAGNAPEGAGSGAALWLGGTGAVLGAAGLGVSLRRRRSEAVTPTP